MTATPTPIKQNLTFKRFIKQLPDEDGRYELVNGKIVKILPTIRLHENVADFIENTFQYEVKSFNLNYRVSGRIMVRTLTSNDREQGRHPDLTVVDKTLWESEPFAPSALTEPPQLVVEVVSTNWEDDYIDKLDEYQRLGISEYWIVDYLALGSRDYLGNPKVATVFVYLLDENGVYQMTAYRGTERIISRTFPELALTAEQVLDV
ncbi:MAG: Uma2 family endonuclease [Microcoleus sp. PH2017_10_PVI_O_A]|uniref:Uma2 family endonuclease n=1 Tax=unclassified Microcoleus TaxID=2642155 RepID=UPI001D93B347|nr:MULTISPECIES: Uma2 family endonuclease [unclassified Microcoleus]TAE79062.1 MAG: Uma2 family endonuclease [Oscillatoriales cyanobacterium]MCC3407491.1 Uma2 family endonuclease [Microcoleus sp. PH2017_10_PVI_O_A]MCC3461559.1 Uma2 family endonuclease [Microcoleus sp. PH2017_11_PCY_U_A]MCC3480046.1 Uma2 family endonuclease [Microcoleus sp. PH2017_12_PCY_D_A]MCC3529752.1 Uma2 family endonuclease [Microcoleus sp. PH2017_21_RUC_O_A]